MIQAGITRSLRWGGLISAAVLSLSSSSVTVEAGEALNRPRSSDYEFTVADTRFDGDGKGVGKLAVAAKITTNESSKRPGS